MYSIRTSAQLIGLLKLWPRVCWAPQILCKDLRAVDVDPCIYINPRLGSVIAVPSIEFVIAKYASGLAYAMRGKRWSYIPPRPFYRLREAVWLKSELKQLSVRSGGFYVYDVVRDRSVAAHVEVGHVNTFGKRMGHINFTMPSACHTSLVEYFGRA